MNIWKVRHACLVATPIVFGIFSLLIGRDTNWDLRNYHWYNPYALLNSRYGLDVTPSGLQSFFSPLLDVPWFILGNNVSAPVVGFLLGAVHSINFVLLYFIASRLLPNLGKRSIFLIALAGMFASGSIGEFGTTFQDNVISIGILGSILIILSSDEALNSDKKTSAIFASFAAVPAGIAVSGKLIAAPFAVGLMMGLLFWAGPISRRLWLFVWFALGLGIAIGIFYGPWMFHLWRETGNPLFPLFNGIFKSPYLTSENFFDKRFGAKTWFEAFTFPFVFFLDPYRVSELGFRDFRILLAWVLVPLFLLLRALRQQNRLNNRHSFIFAFAIVSYVLWQHIFSIYRYAIALEMIAPVVIAIVIAHIDIFSRFKNLVVSGVMLGLLVTTLPPDWGRGNWGEKFVAVEVPDIKNPASTIVVLLNQPIAYVIPSFPREIAFLQLGDTATIKTQVIARLKAHTGEIFSILSPEEGNTEEMLKISEADKMRLNSYGLDFDHTKCESFRTNMDFDSRPSICEALLSAGITYFGWSCDVAGRQRPRSIRYCPVQRISAQQGMN